MISEGKFHLSIIDDFRKTPAFYYALQMSNIPSASAVGDFIKRISRAKFSKRNRKSKKEELVNGIDIIQNIFYETTKEIMKQMRFVLNGIIDYDASVIEENKQYSKKMYTGDYGTMGYFAFMGRICIMPELEPGNHSPSDKADLRTKSNQTVWSCIEFCWKNGIKVKKMRADAASYIANLFNFCNKKKYRKIEFYIRAVSTKALKQSIETVVHYFGAGWKKEKIRQAKKIEGKEIIIGEATHSMDKTEAPFRLICEKKEKNVVTEEIDLFGPVIKTIRSFWSVATNDYNSSPTKVLEIYNGRQFESEHGNQRLKSEFHIGSLPFRGKDGLLPNRAFCYLCAMLHNVFEFYKYECLPKIDWGKKLPTIRNEKIKIPAKITTTAAILKIELPIYAIETAKWLNAVITVLRRFRRKIKITKVAPEYTELIYRRI